VIVMSRPALQLALPKIGIAWMFALLTVNFNRVTIYDLGIAAVVVTLLLGIYPLFAPIQPLFGRWIDRHPLLGYRRGPYLLIGMVGSGLLFTALPWTAVGLRVGNPLAFVVGVILMVLFGLGIALIANTYLDLVAETTDERSRSGVFAVAWTAQTAAIVLWSFVFQRLMPTFSIALMQSLYNLTPLVCLVTTLLGILGLEQKVDPHNLQVKDRAQEPVGNPLEALRVLRENTPARNFFAFVFLAITGIFLQDAVMEVYASRVLHMSLPESTQPQQVWNGAVLIAMLITSPLIAILTARAAANGNDISSLKRRIASGGALVATFALWALASTAARSDGSAFYAVLVLMGLGMGVFTAVTVTMMSDMTVAGATGRYLGLWSMAQAFATSFAFVASGALHTLLIESGWLAPGHGFAVIFGIEGLSMLLSLVMLQMVSVAAFRGAAQRDLARLAVQ
jgi:BCD family chlorophyll transporter-like MFS transporter